MKPLSNTKLVTAIEKHDYRTLIGTVHEYDTLLMIIRTLPEIINMVCKCQYRERKSLLHVHAAAGKYDCVKLLLEEKADPNIRANCNKTPLFRATDECFALLVAYGADVNAVDDHGYPVLFDVARDKIKILLDNGANANCLYDGHTMLTFCEHLSTDTIKMLLDAKVNPNHVHDNTFALLNYQDKPAAIELLLSYGADPNMVMTSTKFRFNNPDVLDLLLEYGLDTTLVLEGQSLVERIHETANDEYEEKAICPIDDSNYRRALLMDDYSYMIRHIDMTIVECIDAAGETFSYTYVHTRDRCLVLVKKYSK